jgi:lysophospholipase L1-like esterase
MSVSCRGLLVLVVLVVPGLLRAEEEKVTLKKGDRIVFLGDSITQAGVSPRGYVTQIRKELEAKHKDLGIEVIGAGISGNKVPDLQARLKRDVLDRKPNVVVIYIGINDVWHSESGRGTSVEKYEAGLGDIIDQIQKTGARVVLCTPTVIGEKKEGTNKLDKMLEEYSAISRKVAKEHKVVLCDLRKAFLNHLKEHNKEDREKSILTSDRVHLNDAGNKLVAEEILKALGN